MRHPVHKGVKYACNQCDQQFTLKRSLTKHIQSAHEGIKYACNQCDKLFTQQNSLTVHIQSIHEGVKYGCNQCDYEATTQRSLTSHRKNKHLSLNRVLLGPGGGSPERGSGSLSPEDGLKTDDESFHNILYDYYYA